MMCRTPLSAETRLKEPTTRGLCRTTPPARRLPRISSRRAPRTKSAWTTPRNRATKARPSAEPRELSPGQLDDDDEPARRGSDCRSALCVVGESLPIDHDTGFAADNPGVVAGWAPHVVAGSERGFLAVVHPDRHLPGDHVAHV